MRSLEIALDKVTAALSHHKENLEKILLNKDLSDEFKAGEVKNIRQIIEGMEAQKEIIQENILAKQHGLPLPPRSDHTC